MARQTFTQYTQAATCICIGRGYVIDPEGYAIPCGCEDGATWSAGRRARAAGLTKAPKAGPKLRRESTRHPGLVLELEGNFLTFTHGKSREVFELKNGDAQLVACTEAGYIHFALFDYVRAVAVAYAENLEAETAA